MPRILVIDDDPAIAELVSINLEMAGYDVNPAEDGIKGQALAVQLQPDLIMLDLMLPKVDGEAVWFESVVKLTHLEFELLHCLLQRHGQTVSPSDILKEVWGYDPDDDIETIRVHIRHLRTKLEPDPRHPRYIKTVYGAGYCLELPTNEQVVLDSSAATV